jgi:hypothetical protein
MNRLRLTRRRFFGSRRFPFERHHGSQDRYRGSEDREDDEEPVKSATRR